MHRIFGHFATVVEFHDSVDTICPAISRKGIFSRPEDLDGQIEQGEALISDLPKQNETITVRLDLINRLAALYQAKECIRSSHPSLEARPGYCQTTK